LIYSLYLHLLAPLKM